MHTHSTVLDKWLQNPNTWLVFAIATAVPFFIILAIVCAIHKQIAIAVEIVIESSKYVKLILKLADSLK